MLSELFKFLLTGSEWLENLNNYCSLRTEKFFSQTNGNLTLFPLADPAGDIGYYWVPGYMRIWETRTRIFMILILWFYNLKPCLTENREFDNTYYYTKRPWVAVIFVLTGLVKKCFSFFIKIILKNLFFNNEHLHSLFTY